MLREYRSGGPPESFPEGGLSLSVCGLREIASSALLGGWPSAIYLYAIPDGTVDVYRSIP